MSKLTHTKFSAAEKERDRLLSETGHAYKVTQNTDGNYICVLTKETKQSDEIIELHPSNKIILGHLMPLTIGLILFVQSEELTVMFYQLLNNTGLLDVITKINGTFEFIGAGIFTLSFLKYLHKIYSKTYVIDIDTVRLEEGIWAKDSKIIKYKDIQTPTLKRSYTDKLFNTGTLLFSSSGTGNIDMIFDKIDAPDAVLELILKKS